MTDALTLSIDTKKHVQNTANFEKVDATVGVEERKHEMASRVQFYYYFSADINEKLMLSAGLALV